ncbi:MULTISPECIES: hypothetical protein [unclassified Crossiella]|uniref:hypothetical protein n=1 Tax=unclassified Crossiella TaxID=2620835 RepID=UPI001FFFC0C8|nr:MULTISPECIES: hypothetical protein [unclassified Crossiella]MCK2240275.1 hypothetical protein [Crossiella sp. S99.2]MCK2253273.1 hypothetical protein [Crossiella sp. S99.1]
MTAILPRPGDRRATANNGLALVADSGSMKYVTVPVGNTRAMIDPEAYLAVLPTLAADLPPGARAFATDPDHYDFHGKRCVKDLKPTEPRTEGDQLVLELRHNCWKHDADLVLRYTGVTEYTVDPPGTLPKDLMLDELLPDEHGVRHEFGCVTGTIVVVAADVTAAWVPTDCTG